MKSFVMIEIDLFAELTTSEIVAYGWIKHRAGKDGTCWESLKNIAKHVPMGITALKEAISGLLAKGKIVKLDRTGKTSIFRMSKESLATEPSRIPTTEPSRIPTTNYIPLDQEKDLINNSLSLTEQPEKSADAERNYPNLENAPSKPIEKPSNFSTLETRQTTKQEGKKSILEGNQLINNHLPVCNLDPSGEKDPAAARSMILDKNKTILGKPTLKAQQQDRARSGSHLNQGIKNKRWDNLADFKKFRAYAIEWARQRREKVTLGTDGQDYGEKWIEIVLSRTANCASEDSTDLTCWKNWQLEKQAFSPEFVAPELAVVTTTIEESRARFKKLLDASNLEIAKNQAAQEAEQKASQEKRWGLMSA